MTLSNKRILHFIESEGVYGAERVILNLSQQLLVQGEYTPVVGCIVTSPNATSALYDAAIKLNIEAIKIPIANSRLIVDLYKASRQLTAEKISLIHSHGYKPSVFGYLLKKITNIPVIATCHLWFEPSKGPLKMRVMITLEKFFYRWFPKIIAVSEPIKQILLDSKLPAENIELIRNGVDTPEIKLCTEEKLALRQTLGVSPNDYCILNSARLNRQKAQWVLIKAANLLKLQGANVKILIVGEGPLHQELSELIAREQVEDQVKLLGFRSDIDKLLSIADLFALPSIDEGMPMSLLEAAAAKTPIVSTDVGDIGKLIKHENTGLIIPLESPETLASAIIRLQNDTLLAQRLAISCHESMVLNYSSRAMCLAYLPIYQSVIPNSV